MNISPLGEHLVKVTFAGRLDTPGVGTVETQFTAHLVPQGNSAIVDMSAVDFVTSLGIRLLISTARALSARKARLVLYGLQDRVRQTLESMAIQQLVPIYATEGEALAAVKPE
jgi:anti-anti-sigma factor